MRRHATAGIAIGLTIIAATSAVRADDLFTLSADSNTGPTVSATASGSSVIDLVEDLIDSEQEFESLEDQGFDASLRYGSIDNAVLVSRNADSTSATLTIPSTGYTKTFTADNAEDLEDQIVDFLLEDGQREYAKFLKTVNEQSALGVVDGNPLAATALLADNVFDRFGLGRGLMLPLESGMPDDGYGSRYEISGGFDSTDEGDGSHASAAISRVFRFGNRFGIAFGPHFTYREIEGADVFHLGGHIAAPIVIIGPEPKGLVWQVTPAFQTSASGSEDLAAGGLLLGGSISSALRIPLGSRLAITIGNQYSAYEGNDLNIFSYEWDTDTSQQLLKNGVRVSFMPTQGMLLDAGVTHTQFLQDAAIDSYITPSIGLGFYFSAKQTSGIRVAYRGDFGDGYDSHGGTASLFFNY